MLPNQNLRAVAEVVVPKAAFNAESFQHHASLFAA
jgi:hypothetical protein